MTEQILQTKLYIPPVRAGVVSRSRLWQRLEQAAQARLLLISAPAGFGKTTLLAGWLASRETVPVAWLTLDEGDNDPNRFYAYLVACLQQIGPIMGRGVLDLLRSSELAAPRAESVVTMLLNEITQHNQTGILVLDDYHVIKHEAIHRAMQFWLDNQPPGFQLALTSRTTPPLALPRLRVRHGLLEIDAEELRFTPAEAAEFLNQAMKLDLTSADVSRLVERTEGWIASIQLAALSLQSNPDPHGFILGFTGDDRFVMDYLMEEVLQRQPGYIRDFLLQTSILGRLNVQLCNAVTGQVGGQQILEDLDRRNLFVAPLDNRRHWYRYHQLFAEFLRAQLERTSPDEGILLHKRASRWYAANGYPTEAVDHALWAGDFSAAADLIAAIADDILWREGQFATLLRWIESLPVHIRNSHAHLGLIGAWALYASGQWDAMEQEFPRLERLMEAEADPLLAARFRGELLVLRAERAIFRSDIAQALHLFQQAEVFLKDAGGLATGMLYQGLGYIHRLEGEIGPALAALERALFSSGANGYMAAQLFSLYDTAAVHLLAGNLADALASYTEMEHVMGGGVASPLVASMNVVRGMILFEQGQLDLADAELARSVAGAQIVGMVGFSRMSHLALARLRQSQGRTDAALAAVEVALDLARQGNTYWIQAQVDTVQARILLAQGQADRLGAWAAEATKPSSQRGFLPRMQHQQEQIVLARYLLAMGELERCMALLDGLAGTAQAAGWCSHLVEIHLLAALCAQAQGDEITALHELGAALRLGETKGYVQIFLDDGPALLPLLERAGRSGLHLAFVETVLARISKTATPNSPTLVSPTLVSSLSSSASYPGSVNPIQPLTRRELEILRLVAAGLSNQQIADQLTIALGTVGKHTSNIFVKLGAANRAVAVLRAGELGLL